jgi:hypothetical protein
VCEKQFWSSKDFNGHRHPELSDEDEGKNDVDELEDLESEGEDSNSEEIILESDHEPTVNITSGIHQ